MPPHKFKHIQDMRFFKCLNCHHLTFSLAVTGVVGSMNLWDHAKWCEVPGVGSGTCSKNYSPEGMDHLWRTLPSQ